MRDASRDIGWGLLGAGTLAGASYWIGGITILLFGAEFTGPVHRIFGGALFGIAAGTALTIIVLVLRVGGAALRNALLAHPKEQADG